MTRGLRAWLQRRDPDLVAIRRAGRVTIVASSVFYAFYYLARDQSMATYGLFAAIAMGFLAQTPGPARRHALTVLAALPAALLLVTIGTLLAGNLWAATAGVLTIGFAITFSRAGGPSLAGIAAGLQLFFILACFPPYAPHNLASRLVGVFAGMVLLAIAELTLWPDHHPVAFKQLLANASDSLADDLEARVASATRAEAQTSVMVDWPSDAVWPAGLSPAARPISASRRDQALKDAGRSLSYALARLHELPQHAQPMPKVAQALAAAASAARATAEALRGGPPPPTERLQQAISAVRSGQHESAAAEDPDSAAVTARSLAAAEAVRGMAIAVRVSLGTPPVSGPASALVHPERFPFAGPHAVQLWWRRFAVHLTRRSVFFQSAVRVALALAAARLVAGTFDLAHGFWVLLATLTLLRGRAATTGTTLGPAAIGTVAGAAGVGILLVVVGPRPDVYAAITPPVMVLSFAAGVVFGLAWGQAFFTVLVALVFTLLAPAGVRIAEVRVQDVLIGAVIGVTAGVLAWPRGARAELRRSTARLLVACGELTRTTVEALAATPPIGEPAATVRVREAMDLVEAANDADQAERKDVDASMPNWSAAVTTGDHVDRGAGILLDTRDPGFAAPWQPAVSAWADQFSDGCNTMAAALGDGRSQPQLSTVVEPPPNTAVTDVHVWLQGVTNDLIRIPAKAPPA